MRPSPQTRSCLAGLLAGLAGLPCAGQGWSGVDYETWAGSWLFGRSGFEASIYGDPDRDGALNFVEFGRGTDPLVADPPSAGHFLPQRALSGNATEFSFQSMPGLGEIGSSYLLSNDLVSWRDSTGEASVSTAPAGDVDLVTVTVPDGTPMASPLFGRVQWSWLGGAVGDPLLEYEFDAGSVLPTTSTSLWVTGAAYDTSRLGGLASLPSSSTTVTIGSDGVGGTDVTSDVPVTTWIRNDAPDDNKEDYHIYVGSLAGGWDLRGLLAFNLATIPDAATITTATVSLYQDGYTTGNNDNEPSQVVDLELWSLTGAVDDDETWNSAAGLFGSALASAPGDPSVTTAGLEHQFSGAPLVAELQGALATDTVHFGLTSPDLEAQSIRHFFVLDGASASNPQAPGAIGPSLEVTYTNPGGGGDLAGAPCSETASTLASALAGDDFHEFRVMVANPGGDLLTLLFDHFGAPGAAEFTSNIAVFTSTDGFATAPTADDARGISSVTVTTAHDETLPLATAVVPLVEENLHGTLTVRLYFYDDTDDPACATRIDAIRLQGFFPESVLLQYSFAGGDPGPDVEATTAVTGSDFSAAVGGFSAPNEQTYAPAPDTGADLAAAIGAGDFHEFSATVSDSEAVLLSLRFDHHGSANTASFTSNIAVFSSSDGFASAPTPGEAIHISSVTVPQGHSESAPLDTVDVPLALTGFTGTLTFRFYFFDDTDQAGSFGRLDTVRIIGDAPGSTFIDTGTIVTPNYTIRIADPGFRIAVLTPTGVALPADPVRGLSFLGSAAVSSEFLGETGNITTYRVTNGNGDTALVDLLADLHTIKLTVALENSQSGAISMRTGSPGPAAFGLGDRGGWESNANLASSQKTYPIRQTGHAHRWLSSFLVFPQQGVAGACFDREDGTVSIGPSHYEMANGSTSQQAFYYFVGSMAEIYAAWRDTRIAEGYPGVAPKMDGFELGFETWDLLRWNTNAASCQGAIQEFLDEDYKIRWAVTGSGFWVPQATTVSFGLYDFAKYPETSAPLPPDFGDWTAARGIRWMIGQRTNFVKTGGPHSSNPGESGATLFNTSPNSQEGLDNDYFLEDGSSNVIERTSTVFPTVPCYLLDGNVPGAAAWFKTLYDGWRVDGVKEDTMMSTPDHTIYNAPMRAIAEGGDLVMARCGAYSSPGTLTRVNDTNGANSMTQRCPINYLQYAASGAPNVYSDTVGFGGMGNVTSTLRHAWLLSLTGGMAVSDSPWNRGWSIANQAKLKKAIDFHYELGPYFHSCAVDSHNTGYPHTMTPLPVAFPADPATYDLASSGSRQFEWMIGPSLLAAPLLHNNYGSTNLMDIYLPAGTWIDIETGTAHVGPTTLSDFAMPLDKTPVFVGGKGVYVSRLDDVSPLQAVVFPLATGGSTYQFTHPDGVSSSSIVNNNVGWNAATLTVTNTTTAAAVPFTPDATTGAIRFEILPGNDYALGGGQ